MIASARVVVTGFGVVAPNGIGIGSFWETLLEGRSAISPVNTFDASDLSCRIAGQVKDFDPAEYIDPKLKPEKRMSRASQFAVACAKMALEHAGLTAEDLHGEGQIPVIIGISSSAMDIVEQAPRPWTGFAIIPHATASAVVYSLGLDARLRTLSCGCASGLDAVAAAVDDIRRGKADVALCGASDSMMTHYVFECFTKLRGLSTRNEDPETASRPFDRDRDGGLIAEGAGMLVLERRERAMARGATVYGEIAGYATSGDSPAGDEGSGMEPAMEGALDNAACRPADIDAISAHGPSDPHMDRIETHLIKQVFGSRAYRIPVTSIKGVTGNPMSVGSIHQLIAALLSMRDGVLSPTANLENADPDCDLDYVPKTARPMDLDTMLINTHGFGRGNSSLVLRRA
ncbi:MAG: beta-ketoacyl-[acyl-carrier-protein] synthase family protein [Lentisphaerae bacterium]|nr:beta-ketoacyl-[acyl-carrier-protein] synthase family protein [Lentisphaerota bacterium]